MEINGQNVENTESVENIGTGVREKSERNDISMMIEAIISYSQGFFNELNRDDFSVPELADVYNTMITDTIKRNNHYLVRINDAQSRIGNTECVKSMVEQIVSLQGAFEALQESRSDITPDSRPIGEANREFLMLADQIKNSYTPCIEEMDDSLEIIDSIDIPDKDYSVEDEDPMWEKLRLMKDYIVRSRDRLEMMSRRVNDMSNDAHVLFTTIDKKSRLDAKFLENVDELTAGYKKLSSECLDTGRHLFRISRDIDNARNDMFRHFTKPTLHDSLSIYEVDHITLTWRLYNNIVEFEALRITQVNNPTGCKFGIWVHNVQDPQILESESFVRMVDAHTKLHECAVRSFVAKQEYDQPAAIVAFEEAIKALDEFREGIAKFRVFLRTIGINEETDVWKFQN